ncbi:MAG: 3-phosphoshikimate 1-carboxyvinyltransferase [Clostridia bacterium]|nr:3-phosphoshikimate 1-carboxyvinyltransferase [Clostridia bacterium]
MIATVYPSKLSGTVDAIPSKSMAHRLLICAAMTEGFTRIRCSASSQDIDATITCLKAMGSNITRIGNYYIVPKVKVHPGQTVHLDCNESGTTLRLMMCIAAGLGLCAYFEGSDRLFLRPLDPLVDALTSHGIVISRDENNRIIQSGKAIPGDFSITGDVSSQFISGLIMMLPLCGGGSVTVTGDFESKPYVDLTASALKEADVKVSCDDRTYTVGGRYDLRDTSIEGDWSNASFWLSAAALGNEVSVKGLDLNSVQGDRGITEILSRFGAEIKTQNECVSAKGNELAGIEIDATNVPDLVPVLAVVAAAAKGTTGIFGAKRLRLKESDRLATVTDMINNLGGNCKITDDGIVITGNGKLSGGEVDACRDHRIAMSAAIAATICDSPVVIKDAGAVGKSYPDFFRDMENLGAKLRLEE